MDGRVEGKNFTGGFRLEYFKQLIRNERCKKFVGTKRLAGNGRKWRRALNQSIEDTKKFIKKEKKLNSYSTTVN